MAIKLTAGYLCKVEFKFYDEYGNVITNLSNAKATLYSTITGESLETLNLNFNSQTNSFEATFTPSNDLQGTYYFIATGYDTNNVLRKSILFVDIVPLTANYMLIGYEQATKFINDVNIDYTVLPSLIITAVEWVQDKLGKVIFPLAVSERISVSGGEYIYLSKYPVIQIKKIVNADNQEEITNYTILNKDSGIIKLEKVPTERTVLFSDIPYISQVNIEYIAGYNPIPETIYTAIGMLVGYMYDRAKYQNFDRIRMLGVEGILSKDVINRILEILMPYIKVSWESLYVWG